MAKRFSLGLIAVICLLLAAASCNKDTVPGDTFVSFTFSTGEIMTRAETPGDGVVATGGGIYYSGDTPDLIILIANSAGNIVMRYPTNGQLTAHSSTSATVKFDFSGQSADNYTVYAFANTEGLWDMTTDQSNTITAAGLINPSTISTVSQLEDLQFKALAANTAPTLLNDRLPLSAKGVINVTNNKNGNVNLELLRCVAKVTAIFINNTEENLTLSSFSNVLYNMCPDRGFVLPHDVDWPTGTNTGNITASESSITINAGETRETDWLVFPGAGPYTCDVNFTIGGRAYSYPGLRVTNSVMVDIPSISRNDNLIIETRISKGLKVSFNFEVADWDNKAEYVEFD